MKNVLIALFFINIPSIVFSQNSNNIYADVACTRLALGSSVTWDKKLIKHLDAGLGAQINDYEVGYIKPQNANRYIRKAVYIDIRPYLFIKRNMLFFICDIGYDFYQGERDNYANNPDNAFYTGAGFGYGRIINKKNMMLYATFKLVSDDYTEHQHLYAYNQWISYYSWDPFFVFSIGVKF